MLKKNGCLIKLWLNAYFRRKRVKKVLISMLQLHKNSGSARSAYEHVRYFKSRGFEVHVVSAKIDTNSVKEMGAIPHVTLPWLKSTGYLRRKWYEWQVQKLANRLQVDLVIGHGDIKNQDIFYLHSAIHLNSELVHGKPINPDYEMVKIHGPTIEQQTFKLMVANSLQMKSDMIRRFNVPDEKIKVIYPALNTDEFVPFQEQQKFFLKEKYKFPQNKVLVGLITSGNLFKRGADKFIKAIDLLSEEIKEKACFLIVGKDKFDPFGMTIKKLKLNDKITYIPHVADVAELYGAVDIFVLPARFEEFGRSTLEAMGMGLPVIVSKFVGCHEIFTGENKDFVLQENTEYELADKLKTLITDKEQRDRLKEINLQDALLESEDNLYIKLDEAFAPWLS
jgi:UDP-glucose:(heptosyl)LPS alpha-1,3-glucosyltransferase